MVALHRATHAPPTPLTCCCLPTPSYSTLLMYMMTWTAPSTHSLVMAHPHSPQVPAPCVTRATHLVPHPGYSVVQGPRTSMARPHPALWRLVHGVLVVYVVWLVWLLHQPVDAARAFMRVGIRSGLENTTALCSRLWETPPVTSCTPFLRTCLHWPRSLTAPSLPLCWATRCATPPPSTVSLITPLLPPSRHTTLAAPIP